ncbi:MAG TPA: HYR domain-containing protein, partial [Thermoanaerobaculia bacterium]|nr:HYR domain-containing protein [Thermoanaerobaculia bacterium]
FPMGETLVTCIASNTAGERAENSFPIIVGDWAPPVIKIPGAIRVKADSREGAYVKYDVTAYDDVYGEVKPLCSPESGSLFKVGTTRVDCSAEDFEGNPGSAVFDVEVVDGAQNALTLHVPDSFLYDADNPEGAYVNYDVTVSGTTDSRVDIKCDPPSGSLFPLKTTTVNCQAGDSLGQFAKASFDVTVADLGDPFIEKATVTPDLFAATGEYVPVSVDVSAVDTVDLKPSCQLYAISSNEKLSRGDATITGTYSATLRAAITEYEARIYRMHMSCSDYSGNKTLFTLYVTVSRDGKAPAPVTAQPTGGKRRASGH